VSWLDQHDEDVQLEAESDHALLNIVAPVILDEDQWHGKDLLRIGEIQSVLAQVGKAFRLVTGEAHVQREYAFKCRLQVPEISDLRRRDLKIVFLELGAVSPHRRLPGRFPGLIAATQAAHGERAILDNLTDPDRARELRDGLRNLYSVHRLGHLGKEGAAC
jgi:hypothetical protein